MEKDFTIEELKSMLAKKEKEEAERKKAEAEAKAKKLEAERKRREEELQTVYDNLMEHEQIFNDLRNKFIEDYHYCKVEYKNNDFKSLMACYSDFIDKLFK